MRLLLLCLPLSRSSAKQGMIKQSQTRHLMGSGPRRNGAGECDVKVKAQGLIMVMRTESQAFSEVTPSLAWLCGSKMCLESPPCLLILRPGCLRTPKLLTWSMGTLLKIFSLLLY